ncbi:MAG: tail fiber domain-containing protein [Acidobacteria bacterium]|nr:tail fiber domain-containing protein [Acidobacteriota bacterium]
MDGAGIRGVATGAGFGVYGSSSTGFAGFFFGPKTYISGNLGVGTETPADKLDVVGNIRIGTGTTGCVTDRDGSVIAGTCASDARFKKNITPFAQTLGKLSQLQPVHFDWRAEDFPDRHFGAARSFGLIAQDVEAILPELVVTDAQGFRAVKYSELPLHMLQAIKELKTENDAVKTQNATLRQQLDTQNASLQAQQAQLRAQEERLRRLEALARK